MTAFAAGLAFGAAAAAIALRWAHGRRRRRLGKFFSFAAHEINTPITAVNMTILNFATGVFGDLPDAYKPWFDILREQTIRLTALVGELRDLIHLEINRDLRLEIGEADAEVAVAHAVEAVAHGFSQTGAKVGVEIETGLPKARADEDRFSRTLVSLLHHARKFKAAGDVQVSARRGGRGVRIEVRYPGAPPAADQTRRSLELFYPADLPAGAAVATGLGLGLLRRLARMQGGELSLAEGDGKTTILRLEMLESTK